MKGKHNLLEYHVKENLKLRKNLDLDLNSICGGIYLLQELFQTPVPKDSENAIGNEDVTMRKGLTPENVAIWIRHARGLWPYSIHLYGIIFDQEAASQVFQLVEKFDLAGFNELKCNVDGNDIKKDVGIPSKRIGDALERALRW